MYTCATWSPCPSDSVEAPDSQYRTISAKKQQTPGSPLNKADVFLCQKIANGERRPLCSGRPQFRSLASSWHVLCCAHLKAPSRGIVRLWTGFAKGRLGKQHINRKGVGAVLATPAPHKYAKCK